MNLSQILQILQKDSTSYNCHLLNENSITPGKCDNCPVNNYVERLDNANIFCATMDKKGLINHLKILLRKQKLSKLLA